jgi:uncharacterized protein DUF4333
LRPAPAVAAAIACCALLAGCGEDERLDTGKVERGIERGVERDRRGVDVTVTCPDDVMLEKGAKFKCRVVGSGGEEAEATVTQVDAVGRVRYVVPPPK